MHMPVQRKPCAYLFSWHTQGQPEAPVSTVKDEASAATNPGAPVLHMRRTLKQSVTSRKPLQAWHCCKVHVWGRRRRRRRQLCKALQHVEPIHELTATVHQS